MGGKEKIFTILFLPGTQQEKKGRKSMKKKVNKLPDLGKMGNPELAKWFDTHDMGDYWDEFDDVKVVVELDKPRTKTLVVRLQEEFRDNLEKMARSKGLNVSTLARMLLIEGINRQLKSTKSSSSG